MNDEVQRCAYTAEDFLSEEGLAPDYQNRLMKFVVETALAEALRVIDCGVKHQIEWLLRKGVNSARIRFVMKGGCNEESEDLE